MQWGSSIKYKQVVEVVKNILSTHSVTSTFNDNLFQNLNLNQCNEVALEGPLTSKTLKCKW